MPSCILQPLAVIACLAILAASAAPAFAQRAQAPDRGAAGAAAADDSSQARDAAASQEGAHSQAQVQQQKPVIDQVVSRIIEEARRHWKEHEDWPRKQSSFARDHPAEIPGRDLLNALATEHHHDPRVDAYVRWQLLSYEPPFEQLSGRQYQRLLEAMPPLMSTPEPNVQAFNQATARLRAHRGSQRRVGSGGTSITMGGTSMGDVSFGGGNIRIAREQAFVTGFRTVPGTAARQPVVETVRSGTFLQVRGTVSADGRYVTLNVRTINQQLIELRRETIRTAIPGVLFRDDLIGVLPAAGGIQLAGQMMDLRERIEAGSDSVEKAIDRLKQRAVEQADHPEITPRQRQALLEKLKELNRVHRVTHERVQREGDLRFTTKQKTIRLSQEDYIDLYWALRGQPRRQQR